ncbi:CopG family ribbon-helix-helix protein [Candidatus Bathyarchaeota archaeon]|nr:CopG family ribbon-helix-helix protein [Candidatus Bathyarchaeota archaeon]MBL7079436.1 CopG family ribbon-helix-helix protein [Candidatus Bathyarchaeota archaeon]
MSRLDLFVKNTGYSSRSEAVRMAVRDTLSKYALERLERGQVVSTVTVISEREQHALNSHLMDLRHEYDNSIFSNMHLHVGTGYCIEIFMVRDEYEKVLDFVSRVRALRGIREVNYTLTPIDEREFER